MGQIIRFPSPAGSGAVPGPDHLGGFVAGTRLATARGWQPVERVVPGEMVLTAETGLREVRHVAMRMLAGAMLVTVPSGVLGNEGALLLLPDQHVLQPCGAGVAVRAESLLGIAGIKRRILRDPVEVVTLGFSAPCGVFANVGSVLACSAEPARAETVHAAPISRRVRRVSISVPV